MLNLFSIYFVEGLRSQKWTLKFRVTVQLYFDILRPGPNIVSRSPSSVNPHFS